MKLTYIEKLAIDKIIEVEWDRIVEIASMYLDREDIDLLAYKLTNGVEHGGD
jgi:hypothetical protein